MVSVTAIHQEGGCGHEHITSVRWRDPADGKTGQSSTAEMVSWIKDKNGDARVTDGANTVKVGVVDASPPYIRTHADGKWTDNLLALPTYE